MGQTLTIKLDTQTGTQLEALSQALGFSHEMAAMYAIRLVSACMREGLLRDIPACAWPREAGLLTETDRKVIAFPGAKTAGGEFRA